MPSTLVSLEIRDKLKTSLAQKGKTRRPLTVEDALKAIRPSVKKILKRGYVYQDIVTELEQLDIAVTPTLIETFYAPKPKGRSKKKTPDKSPELTQPITEQQKNNVVVQFEELAKTRKGLTLRELVGELEAEIDEDLQARWEYEDIARWFHDDFCIKISPGTLKRYHGDLKRQAKTAPTETQAPQPPKTTPHSTPKRLSEPTVEERSKFAEEFNL